MSTIRMASEWNCFNCRRTHCTPRRRTAGSNCVPHYRQQTRALPGADIKCLKGPDCRSGAISPGSSVEMVAIAEKARYLLNLFAAALNSEDSAPTKAYAAMLADFGGYLA